MIALCAQRLVGSQLSLPHEIETKVHEKELKIATNEHEKSAPIKRRIMCVQVVRCVRAVYGEKEKGL